MRHGIGNDVLAELLARCRTLDPEYAGGLANHLPMALCALSALGAPGWRLRTYAERSRVQLEPLRSGGPAIDEASWQGFVGDPQALAGMHRCFDAAIARDGDEAVLARVLPVLMPGLCAHAFHGLIRTAYAIRFGDAGELAHGLAYWATDAAPLAPLPERTGRERDPLVVLASVRAAPALRRPSPRGGFIAERLQHAAARAGFDAAVAALDVGGDSLARMAEAMARAYAAQPGDDLTALHAITGAHAYRIVEPYYVDSGGERDLARRWLWQTLLAGYVSVGAPDPELAPRAEPPSWDAILAEAVGRCDDHDVKLVDSVREEERAHGIASARLAAARRLGLA